MSLYPDSIVCPVCDRLLSYAWNENARCQCDDEPPAPRAVRKLGEAMHDSVVERARRKLGIRT